MAGPRVRDNLKRGATVTLGAPSLTCGACGFMHYLHGSWLFKRDETGTISGVTGATWVGGSDMADNRGPDFDWCGECGVRFEGGVTVE